MNDTDPTQRLLRGKKKRSDHAVSGIVLLFSVVVLGRNERSQEKKGKDISSFRVFV